MGQSRVLKSWPTTSSFCRHSQQNDEIRRQSSERFSIYRRCKVEDIDLPLESGSLEDVPLDEVSHCVPIYLVHIAYPRRDHGCRICQTTTWMTTGLS